MATHWTDSRTAVALIGGELARRGWKLYGWKENRSDSMTDYYDPESWDGVATKGDVVVCVDVHGHDVERHSGKLDPRYVTAEGPCSPCNGTGKRLSDWHEPASTIRDIFGGSVTHTPECFHQAGDPCSHCEGTGSRKESRQDPTAETWPTFRPNPPRCNWHVERDGVVIAQGTGVFVCVGEKWDTHHTCPEGEDKCTRCGKSGDGYDLRHDTCPEGRPKLRAIVDRIELGAFGAGAKACPTCKAPGLVPYGARCACGQGNWQCSPDGDRMVPALKSLGAAATEGESA